MPYDPGYLTRNNSGNIASAAWGVNGPALNFAAATLTDTSSAGTVATAAAYSIGTTTLAASAATTYTNAATLFVAGPPAAGTNVTITTGHNIWLGGVTGSVAFGDTTPGRISGTLGAITVAASGTNQSITLTPSGTGGVSITGTGLAGSGLLRFAAGTTSATGISWGANTTLYQTAAGKMAFDHATNPVLALNVAGTIGASWEVFGSDVYLQTRIAARTIFFQNNGTTSLSLIATQAKIPGTNTLQFGATANATIGASADTTAGDLVATTTSTGRFVIAGTGILAKAGGTVPLITTTTAITTGAGVGVGTLANAPAAGDPTKWVPINDNGTTRYIPAW